MTGRATFSDEEWNLLVNLPRWVVRAASASQRDNARRTFIEVEAGFLSIAEGRTLGSDLVKEIAQHTMAVFDQPRGRPEDAGMLVTDSDTEAGLAAVIDHAQAAVAVMAAKAPADASAYRRWLLAISDEVVSAAKSHDTFGIGGVYVTESEETFDRRLERAIAET